MHSAPDIAEKVNARVVASLQDNLTLIRSTLRMPRNRDCVVREFVVAGERAALLYIDGLTNRAALEMHVLEPCMRWSETARETPPDLITYLAERVLSIYDLRTSSDMDECIHNLLNHKALMLVNGCDSALMLESRWMQRRTVDRPINESVVLGAQEGFVENLRANLALVRAGVHSPRLVTEMLDLGKGIPTQCAVMYLDGVAEETVVQEVLRRIRGVAMDYVPGVGHLEQLIEDHPFSIYPQICSTERSDRACSFLLEGQVLVFVDGSPLALAMPVTLLHIMHTPDDTSMRWQFGTFLRLIRTAGMYAAMFMPGIYLALVVHHHQAIPSVFLSSLYEAQARMPLPLVVEALVMIVSFHLINEASTRVPGTLGSSLGVVSALILGQAAVTADLASPFMIIVVAVSGLGMFAVPDFALGMGLKIRQLLYVLVANFWGLYGMILLYLLLQTNLGMLHSFGVPYYAPISPPRPHNPDLLVRYPLWKQRLRGFYAQAGQRVRAWGRVRSWDRPGKKR